MATERSIVRIMVAGTVIAVAAATVAGCGGGAVSTSDGSSISSGTTATAATAAKAPKACKLFTAKLAHTVLGKTVKLTINKYENPLLSQCEYNGTAGFVAVLSGPWDEIKASAANGKPIVGIGDQAISSPGGLFIRKGTVGISVDAAITGTFSGAAADSVEKREAATDKKLGKALVRGL